MKSVSELISEHRAKEIQVVKDYIISKGGDGLVCCECECGCRIDDLIPCEMDADEMTECYPAKGKMGEYEGYPSMIYYEIEEATSDETNNEKTT